MQQNPLLLTKLYIPPIRPELVSRPRLIERLNEGLYRKLTLISAPAGFGKTTLVSEWAADYQGPVAWLSLTLERCETAFINGEYEFFDFRSGPSPDSSQ